MSIAKGWHQKSPILATILLKVYESYGNGVNNTANHDHYIELIDCGPDKNLFQIRLVMSSVAR